MRRKIKITYATYDDKGTDQYISNRTVSLDEPLRAIALSVINESIGKTKHNWLEETHDDQPIVLYLDNSGKDPLQGFGIQYGINLDGTLQFLNNYAPLQHEWTLAEIYELRDSGYINGNDNLLIATPEGLGSDGFEIARIIDMLIYIGGVYAGFEVIAKLICYIKNRTLIKKWKHMDLRGLHQIRSLMDEKSVWTTDEVKKRLAVSEQLATSILTKLGYQLSGDNWHLAHTKESLDIRNKWLVKEKEIEARQKRGQ